MLPGLAIAQQIGRGDGIQAARAVAGKHGDDLHAERRAALPGRHQQQRRAFRQRVAVAQRGFRAGDEGGAQRIDQLWHRQRRAGRGGVDHPRGLGHQKLFRS